MVVVGSGLQVVVVVFVSLSFMVVVGFVPVMGVVMGFVGFFFFPSGGDGGGWRWQVVGSCLWLWLVGRRGGGGG